LFTVRVAEAWLPVNETGPVAVTALVVFVLVPAVVPWTVMLKLQLALCTSDPPVKVRLLAVVVYDPPHVPNQGQDRSKDFNTRFGLVLKSPAENGYNFSHLYPPFVQEAHRVLKPEGILLCKIADYVHGHRFQWAHIEVIKAAAAVGFCPCDCIVKIRKGPIVSPRWKTAHHARRHHCYWLILRKSDKCE